MTPVEQAEAFLTAMIAATGRPVAAEPEEVLASFATIAQQREALLAKATVDLAVREMPAIKALARELTVCDAAWTDALERARNLVDERLLTLRRVRQG